MAATAPFHRSAAIAAIGIAVCTRSVAAHGSATAGDGIVPLPGALAVVTLLGVSAGVVAAITRDPGGPHLVGRAVGPLLVGIGGWAAVSVAISRPMLGLGGTLIGIFGGVVFARRGHCGDVATGAIAVHRFVEGVALAALSVTASAVGLVGLVVLTVHTVAECIAVGGQPDCSRSRAVGAVLVIAGAFVAGAGLGTVGLVAVPTALRTGAIAIVGGLLFTVGLVESRSAHSDTPSAGAPV